MLKPPQSSGFLFAVPILLLALCFPEISHAAETEGYHRLPGHVDSWIALVIVLASVLVAFALNHAYPNIRAAGTFLASLGCFMVFIWFLSALDTGFVSNPKEPVLPIAGVARPGILWAIGLLSLAAGVLLGWATVRQMDRTDQLSLLHTNSDTKFGRVSRYLHWTTAILFLSLLPMGFFMPMIPEDVPWRQGYYVVHKTIGFMVLLLVLARLAWHLKAPTPALDPSLKNWERRLARTAHVLLYVLMIALPLSGFIMSTYGGKLSHFFIWDLPLFWATDMEAIQLYGLLHKLVLPYLCLLVLGAHLLGALKHHFIDKHPEGIRRMVS